MAFLQDTHDVGKEFTVGIEGTNGTLRHRVRRVFRKTCCFSKKLRNHWKVFDIAFSISIMASFNALVYFVDHLPDVQDKHIPKYEYFAKLKYTDSLSDTINDIYDCYSELDVVYQN
jgi:hypothetical protein